MRLNVVYIAGRFRGPTAWDVAQNVRRAEEAGLAIANLGAMPLIPHCNTANFHGQCTDEFWLDGTAELLRRCDAVYVFDPRDAERSAGTKGEIRLAREIGKPVFFDHDAVAHWICTGKGGRP